MQKDRKRVGKHNKETYEEIVLEPVGNKVKSIIANNEFQQYADCYSGRYRYRRSRHVSIEKTPPQNRDIERELKYFMGWLNNGLNQYHLSTYEGYFNRLAKKEYDEWKAQELTWPEFPIDVPSRVKTISGYYKDKYITVPFSKNDLNDVRGFITAGHIVYSGLRGYLGNHNMKCHTYVKSNIDFYIDIWKCLIYENTGIEWGEL